MSLRHFSKAILQAWGQLVGRRLAPRVRLAIRLKRLNVRLLGPRFWRQVAASGKVQSRSAGVIGSWARYGHMSLLQHARLVGVMPQPNSVDVIRKFFVKDNERDKLNVSYPTSLDGYDIGDPLGKGCNASVYAARVRHGDAAQMRGSDIRPLFSIAGRIEEPYNLAIKMMYNYTFGSRVSDIIQACRQELVPSTAASVQKLMRWDQTVSRGHANIINVHTAFIDRVRLFADSILEYPQALPAHLHSEGLGWDQTLFIVMSRYKMTLRQYILTYEFGCHTGQVLYGQLVEAIRFLADEKIAHRDLKTNNLLIEFNRTSEIPVLVVSDFGCCLANDSLKLPYFDEETDLGGNMALRPPEISCAQPGFLTFLDFSRSDLWASGAIAYEIFTRCNPFYKRTVTSKTYREVELPELPTMVPKPVKSLIRQILSRKPEKRPTPECAASVMALSCFDLDMLLATIARGPSAGFGHLKSHLTQDEWAKHLRPQKGTEAAGRHQQQNFPDRLADLMSLYSAETMIGRVTGVLCRSEVLLRTSFLSRLDSATLRAATDYFI